MSIKMLVFLVWGGWAEHSIHTSKLCPLMFSSQCPQSDHCQSVCYRKAITLKRKVVKLDQQKVRTILYLSKWAGNILKSKLHLSQQGWVDDCIKKKWNIKDQRYLFLPAKITVELPLWQLTKGLELLTIVLFHNTSLLFNSPFINQILHPTLLVGISSPVFYLWVKTLAFIAYNISSFGT